MNNTELHLVVGIGSCIFKITDPNSTADIDLVNFYIDNIVVPHDKGCQKETGRTWTDDEHIAIEFCNEPCALHRNGNNHRIQATFGCETIIVE